MLAALPSEYHALPRETVHLRAVKTTLSELAALDWAGHRRQQADEVRAKLLPLIQDHPGWRVQYFGAAPIPLAMALAYIIGPWGPIDVYQQRHDTNSWRWIQQHRSDKVRFAEMQLPQGKISAEGAVVIRVSISHRIDPADTRVVIPHSLAEIDIALEAPDEDALQSPEDLKAVKAQFDLAVDRVHEMIPNAEIHVFAAVTVGVAFRLGMSINPTIHSLVHAYQYSKFSSPRYQHALTLQRAQQAVQPLTAEEISEAKALRVQIGVELDGIRNVAKQMAERDTAEPVEHWLKVAVPDAAPEHLYGPSRGLAKVFDTALMDSSVDQITTQISNDFFYHRPSRMWRFDDRFLATLAKRFPDEADRRQAVRLLILHEGVHETTHGLTGETSQEARRFPKVVEEVDYQADVWAYVHDYAIQNFGKVVPEGGARAFFLNVLKVALDTFWAFDALSDPGYMEIRRMNRYLIWYWQLLRLELCSNLNDVLKVLASRPVIEVAGPRVEAREGRVFYSLDPARFDRPELGLFYNYRILRYGDGPASRVRELLIGFREQDQAKIRESLKSISDQIPR